MNNTAAETQARVDETKAAVVAAEDAINRLQEQKADMLSRGLQETDGAIVDLSNQLESAKRELLQAQNNAFTAQKLQSFQTAPGRFTGGFAKGGNIPARGFGLVGEAGPEFISGPANVMSARNSMGVMQTLMKSIRGLDSSVQESKSNVQNQLSNAIQSNISNGSEQKFDTMISLLSQLVQVESYDAGTQKRIMKATKGLQGNLLRGV